MNIICTHCGGHKYGLAGPKCTCPDSKTERIKELESQLSEAREALKTAAAYLWHADIAGDEDIDKAEKVIKKALAKLKVPK